MLSKLRGKKSLGFKSDWKGVNCQVFACGDEHSLWCEWKMNRHEQNIAKKECISKKREQSYTSYLNWLCREMSQFFSKQERRKKFTIFEFGFILRLRQIVMHGKWKMLNRSRQMMSPKNNLVLLWSSILGLKNSRPKFFGSLSLSLGISTKNK